VSHHEPDLLTALSQLVYNNETKSDHEEITLSSPVKEVKHSAHLNIVSAKQGMSQICNF
jgi:hypothetical protein